MREREKHKNYQQLTLSCTQSDTLCTSNYLVIQELQMTDRHINISVSPTLSLLFIQLNFSLFTHNETPNKHPLETTQLMAMKWQK